MTMSKSLSQFIFIINRVILIICFSNVNDENDSITKEIKFPSSDCLNDQCDARILNGSPADKEKFNFIVSVTMGTLHHCGGSLIKPNWVITAAHCGYGKSVERKKKAFGSIHVRPGPHDLIDTYRRKRTNGSRIFRGITATVNKNETIKVKKVFLHASLYMSRVNNSDLVSRDIALLWLVKSVENAKLPQFTSKADFQIYDCTAAGWGMTDLFSRQTPGRKLLQMNVKVFRGQVCRQRYERTLPNITKELKKKISLNVLCLETKKSEEKASLSGDSGSPLLCGGKLRGITSLVIVIQNKKDFAKYKVLNIYVDFDCYVSWINKILRKNGEAKLEADDHSYLCNFVKNIHTNKNIHIVFLLFLYVFCL